MAIMAIPIANTISTMVANMPVSSIERASETQTRFFIWSIIWFAIAALITAFFTVKLYQAGNTVQSAIKADADARIAESRALASKADENAAKANERAAEANAEAAKANESAALANERAQRLEQDNLALRGDLNKAASEVAILQKSAADARAEQQRVQTALAAQQERAAIAEKALLELQERIKPRTLTAEKRARILEILKPSPKGIVKIAFAANDNEALSLATQIAEVLVAAGWQASPGGPTIESTTPKGLGIFVRNEQTPGAGALQHALAAVGFPAGGMTNPELPEGHIVLFVGQKP
ncbi:MAG: hypothetical protein SF339_01060 [Blastocatellia bacterium]|nr:hypothetical protein [Blastocatellia bacterium]